MASTSNNAKGYLKRIIATSDGELFPLTSGEEIIIGRKRQAVQILIQNCKISRTHCALKNQGSSWFIKDMKSVNGTFLDGKILNPGQYYPLKDGAIIHLGSPAEAPAAFIFQTKIDMTTDIAMVESIANFEGKSKTDSKNPEKPSFKPKMVETIHIRNYKKNPQFLRSLRDKLNCIIERNSLSTLERIPLRREVIKCINIEKRKKNTHGIVTWNHRLGQMTKVWPSREMPVDKISLEMTAIKDVFYMSCLNEFLQTKSDASDIRKKAEELAKEYLSFKEEKKESFRKSEIIRKLASKYCKQKDNSSSSSSKHHHCNSLTRMVKKVYGDVKNVHIFSFRPLIDKSPKSSVGSERVSCPKLQESHESQENTDCEKMQEVARKDRFQNGSSQSEKVIYCLGDEIIILLKSPCANTGKTRSDKQKSDSSTANNLQNLERLLFNRDQQDHQLQKSESPRTQLLRDSISHNRQLSRLKNVNSKRGVLSEDIVIQEASTAQNKDEQGKVAIANRRRKVVEKLREAFNTFRLDETEAMKN